VNTDALTTLGDQLEAAARRDLEQRPRRSRRLVVAVVALAIVVPAAAYAGERLISNDDVAASMPAGTLALAGTEPKCTTVQAGVEYACELATPPAPEVSDWQGTVEPTVDASKHVNGGCRSLNSAGTKWECYLGQAAVRQQIVSASFLGEYAPSPGVG
jgi:hypothetical protein